MDTAQIKGQIARLGELLKQEDGGPEAAKLALNLLENFLLNQQRQTELLEWLANMAQAAENARLDR